MGQFKRSAHLVDSTDKEEAVKVPVREIGVLNIHTPTAHSYLQQNKANKLTQKEMLGPENGDSAAL